jgi:hypothetical protein
MDIAGFEASYGAKEPSLRNHSRLRFCFASKPDLISQLRGAKEVDDRRANPT